MRVLNPKIFASFLMVVVLSCKENSSYHKPSADIQAQGPNQDSGAKAVTTISEIKFSKAVLYTIDKSIYNAKDTIWDFPDGKHAYEYAFGGGAFIDTAGNAIHRRFNKFHLTADQIVKLKREFIHKLCDGTTTTCLTMYRDVIVLQDSLNKTVGQAQICFSCADIAVYPAAKFNCIEESDLNFMEFKTFVNSIKDN